MHYNFPIFDGTNFLYWKERMESHLETLQNEIWEIIKTGYIELQGGAKTLNEMKSKEDNAKAIAIIFSSISDSMFKRVKGLKKEKIAWNKLGRSTKLCHVLDQLFSTSEFK